MEYSPSIGKTLGSIPSTAKEAGDKHKCGGRLSSVPAWRFWLWPYLTQGLWWEKNRPELGGSKSNGWCPKVSSTQDPGETATESWGRLKRSCHKPRKAWGHQDLRQGGRTSPMSFWRGQGWLPPVLGASVVFNCPNHTDLLEWSLQLLHLWPLHPWELSTWPWVYRRIKQKNKALTVIGPEEIYLTMIILYTYNFTIYWCQRKSAH